MSGVLVLAEAPGGALPPAGLELIEVAQELSAQGAGQVSLALICHDAEQQARAIAAAGVERMLVVPAPEPRFEPHVSQHAVEALIERERPALVLAAHGNDTLGFLPAVAARGRHGFAGDVLAVTWSVHGARAERGAYGERLIAELDFPGKQTVILLLRAGSFAPADRDDDANDKVVGPGDPTIERIELALDDAPRSERIELRDAPDSGVELDKADLVLAIGRGVGNAERVAELERLATRIGATLAVSGPLVEAGWASRALKVGQSGKTVAPRVYLALGISGAAQHLAGMSRSRTIIAVNSDPGARIFDVADYGAVADLFEVAAGLERELG